MLCNILLYITTAVVCSECLYGCYQIIMMMILIYIINLHFSLICFYFWIVLLLDNRTTIMDHLSIKAIDRQLKHLNDNTCTTCPKEKL